jgi:hypothetical protein
LFRQEFSVESFLNPRTSSTRPRWTSLCSAPRVNFVSPVPVNKSVRRKGGRLSSNGTARESICRSERGRPRGETCRPPYPRPPGCRRSAGGFQSWKMQDAERWSRSPLRAEGFSGQANPFASHIDGNQHALQTPSQCLLDVRTQLDVTLLRLRVGGSCELNNRLSIYSRSDSKPLC